MIGEHAMIPNLVLARRRDETDETREKAMGLEHDMGRAGAARAFEGEPDAAIGKLGDGIVGERRSQHVPEHPLETFAVTAIDEGRGLQRHAVRRDLERANGRRHVGVCAGPGPRER